MPNRVVAAVVGLMGLAGAAADAAERKTAAPAGSATVEAAQQLVRRLLPPASAAQIELGLLPANASTGSGVVDAFELAPPRDPATGALLLRGTSGVALAAGLRHYLFAHCNSSFSWLGDNLAPAVSSPHLPRITPRTAARRRTALRFRFALNYCVWAYSVPYWDWARWEREIDLMAMWGVNLVNMIVAMPWVYTRVFQSMGLSVAQIPLPGPSFSNSVGSDGSFEGPLPQRWIEEHRQLQHRILKRMKSLGISAVLPAFSGAVPQAFPGLPQYSSAKINVIPGYGDFTSTMAYIDPGDPLFQTIGEKFVRTNREEFGDHGHFYDGGTWFDERMTPIMNADYVATVARSGYRAMTAADPDAVWVDSGWRFLANQNWWMGPKHDGARMKAFLHAIPKGKHIARDLAAEFAPVWQGSESFYGTDWIWVSPKASLRPFALAVRP